MSEEIETARRYIPSPVKILVVLQSFVIAYLGFWMYQNYQNDFYFQAYVNASLQGSDFAIVALSSVGIFSAVAMGLYMKRRRTHNELEQQSLPEHSEREWQRTAHTTQSTHVGTRFRQN